VEKTKLIIRWEREKEFSESVWERENDGLLYNFYTRLLDFLDLFIRLGYPKEMKNG